MTYLEAKRVRKQLRFAFILCLMAVVLMVGRHFLINDTQVNIASATELANLDSRISSTMKDLEGLEYSISTHGKQITSLEDNKDNYVKALGLLCDVNQLDIHSMSVDDIKKTESISSMDISLEVVGDISRIKDFISDVNASEMFCRVDSLSYRLQNANFGWMAREIDKSGAIGWWNIRDVSGYLLEDDDAADEDELDLLDANAFMKHSKALCYLKFHFIGTV